MRLIKYIFLLIILILVVAFAALNAQRVPIHYYIGERELPLIILLLLSFALGILFGLITMLGYVLRARCKQKKLKKRIKLAEKELDNLRTMPIKDQH